MRRGKNTLWFVVLFCIIMILPEFVLGAESDFKLAEYTQVVLDNGLTLYLMEQHEVPLIYVSFVFPAGAVKDGEQSGLASR